MMTGERKNEEPTQVNITKAATTNLTADTVLVTDTQILHSGSANRPDVRDP